MPKIKAKSPNARRVPFSAHLAYNPAAARYYDARNGRFRSPAQVRDILDGESDTTAARMVSHGDALKQAAQRFKDGAITQDDYTAAVKSWRNQMAADVKAIHYQHAAIARGGFHGFTPADHGALGGRLRVQFSYLENFAIECAANPDIVLSLDKSRRAFDERCQAYSQTARETYEAFREDEEKRAGFEWEANLLDDGAAHCKRSRGRESCTQQSDKGIVPMGDLVRVGRRACSFMCRCQIMRFKTKTAAEAWLASATT